MFYVQSHLKTSNMRKVPLEKDVLEHIKGSVKDLMNMNFDSPKTTTVIDMKKKMPPEKFPLFTVEDYKYLASCEEHKQSQQYFICGYIEENENGEYIRNDTTVIRKELITIDYDDGVTCSYNEFVELLKQKIGNYKWLVYPTIKAVEKYPRIRLILVPSRPLLKKEYKAILKEFSNKIPFKYDSSSLTWSQCMGLPVVTPRNKDMELFINHGVPYPVPDKIEIQDKKKTKQKGFRTFERYGTRLRLTDERAIEILKEYAKREESNLQEYSNFVSAMLVLAKEVQNGTISEETGYQAMEILACGNTVWIDENIKRFEKELDNPNITTQYNFTSKFCMYSHEGIKIQDSDKITSFNQLRKVVMKEGAKLRQELAKVDVVTGEIKIKKLTPRQITEILKKYCHFANIKTFNPDQSPLVMYNVDEGIYMQTEKYINQLILAIDNSVSEKDSKTVMFYLRTEIEEKEITKNDKYIVCNNGIYNTETKQLEQSTPDYIFLNKIHTNYNPEAVEPDFDGWKFSDWLKELSGGDDEKLKLLKQVIKTSIHGNSVSDVVFFFFSELGKTGKSTFERLLINLVGEQNTATLKIAELEHDFKLAVASGKTLIIGDDNDPNDYNPKSENLKRIATGEPLLINPKGKTPYTIELKAQIIQSMNGIPSFKDTTDGMIRRLRVLKFNKKYDGDVGNRDVKNKYIYDKRLLEYILLDTINIEIEEIINTNESKEIVNGVVLDNNPIALFVSEVIPMFKSERLSVRFLFWSFNTWAKYEQNMKADYKQNTFTKRLKELLNDKYEYVNASKLSVYFNEDDLKTVYELNTDVYVNRFTENKHITQGVFHKK